MDSFFSIYFYHGGKMVSINGEMHYVGGEVTSRFGLDSDKFGYFDLEEEVEKLGYLSWDGLFYKIPRSAEVDDFMDVSNDAGVMDMIKYSLNGKLPVYVYVVGGKHDEIPGLQSEILEYYGEIADDNEEVEVSTRVESDKNEYGIKDFDEENGTDDSSEDEEYVLPLDVESDSEDGLCEDDLDTDDDEYIKARENRFSNQLLLQYTAEGSNCGSGGGLQSDDVSSNDEVNSDSSSSDEMMLIEGCSHTKKPPKIMYDPKCDHKDFKFIIGMTFESQKQCKAAIQRVAIVNGYNIQFMKTNSRQVYARCVDGCPWNFFASFVSKEKIFAIKTLVNDHRCGRDMSTRQVTAKWIASEYIENFRRNPNWSVEQLKADLSDKYAVKPSRWKLLRGKWQALELLRGSVVEHYAFLRRYMAALMEVDKEGRFEFLLGDASVFKGFYVGFSALKKGFVSGCRKIIGFDGCFLKTFLGGALLAAIAKDGNNQMYPIAWAVVDAENESCWMWFLSILFQELGITDGFGWSFISDQQKGLTKAISELTPNAEHRNCARHIYINFKKKYKGSTLKNIFWKCVRSTYMAAYNDALLEMKEENEEAYENFLEREPVKFCKAFVSIVPRSDMVDNNVSETFNGYILKGRGKHIIDMLEHIRSQLMERHHENLNKMSSVTDNICPRVRKKVEDAKYNSRLCEAKPAVGDKFEVSIGEDQFIVDLNYRTCTCRAWDLTGIPCLHGCAAIQFMKRDVADYVDRFYTVTKYLEAYKHPLEPLNGKKMWPEAIGEPIKPPPYKKMPGRPKKKRKRNSEEERRSRRYGLQMTCQRCLKSSHNQRSCTDEAVEKPPKRKVGRPCKQDQGGLPRSREIGTSAQAVQTRTETGAHPRLDTRSQTSGSTRAREKDMLEKDLVSTGERRRETYT